MARPMKTTTNMTTLAEGVTACARALDRIPIIMRPHVLDTLYRQTTLDLAIMREQVRLQQAQQAAAVPEPQSTADEVEIAAMDPQGEDGLVEIPKIEAEVTPD